ncbi:MAG: HigA family addiction module antitoxin [Hyphomicrobiales bacterium]|nr:HigA family addiction module antitoxin [Hyphomicrobiales bacterium]
MKSPCHPGRDIGFALEYLNLSTAKGAKALGVSRSQLHRVIQGECAISPEMALRLEKVIGSTVGSWLRMQAAYDEAQTRKKAASITKGLKRLSVPTKSKKAI